MLNVLPLFFFRQSLSPGLFGGSHPVSFSLHIILQTFDSSSFYSKVLNCLLLIFSYISHNLIEVDMQYSSFIIKDLYPLTYYLLFIYLK
jgi:hypothetical protein